MFDFPSSPTNGQTVTGSGGQAYAWNGYAWTAQGSGMSQSTADARYVNVTGDAMTGLLSLSADPQTGSQAATKHYVDNAINLAGNYLGTWQVAANTPNINAGGTIDNANYVAVTANPAVAETVPAGVPGLAGQSVSNGDRIIWASSLSIWQVLRGASLTVATADGRYVQLAGSTMTGLLTLSGDPTSPLNPVTLQYLNAHSGGTTITVSDTPPPSPTSGALWFDSVGVQTYLWFIDASGPPGQWVPVNAPPSSTVAYLPTAGGTMSGAITQPVAPVATTDLTNKAYVDKATGNSAVPLVFAYSGKPAASGRIIVPVAVPLTLPTNLTGSQFHCNTNPTASAAFTLYQNATSLGTITISTAGAPTYATTSATLVAGDYLMLVAPGTQDSTLDTAGFAFLAARN